MTSRRRSRFASTVARAVAEILEFEVKDPVLRAALPTVLGVRLSPDGEEAVVAVAVGGEAVDREAARAALAHDGAFVRARLARRLAVRRVPKLSFVLASALGSPPLPQKRDG